MRDRTELLESALDSLPDGIALLGMEGEVVFWNHAAEAITGYAGVGPAGAGDPRGAGAAGAGRVQAMVTWSRARIRERSHGAMVRARHKLGHERAGDGADPGAARRAGRADRHGGRLSSRREPGCAAARRDAAKAQTWRRARRSWKTGWQTVFEDFARGGQPFGVLWITVDQAHGLAQDARRRAPARRCWKRWSRRWPTGCGRPRRWGAGATMSF